MSICDIFAARRVASHPLAIVGVAIGLHKQNCAQNRSGGRFATDKR
jgi:hypothetical protein